MDMETFLTQLYSFISEWYRTSIAPEKGTRVGAKPQMSDEAVLTVALAGQWKVGAPWQSERGVVRYIRAHYRHIFPQMLKRSAFNRRVRNLYGVFLRLQDYVGRLLSDESDSYECVDCMPLPAYSNAQSNKEKGHWLWESTFGRGGTRSGFFVGDHLLAAVSPQGVVTGWLIATACIQDRWLMEVFLSTRAGDPKLVGPPHDSRRKRSRRVTPPLGFIGPLQAVGTASNKPYLADQGYNGQRWISHWQTNYQATVITVPVINEPARRLWSDADKTWLASHRQIVDTVFSRLDTIFRIKHLNAHSRWGQLTRLAAIIAAYHIGLWFNRQLGRPLGALGTLLC